MRARGSIGGPLVLILIGVLFLLHTFSPDLRVVDFFARTWPYFLIFWGVVQLIEIFARAARGGPIQPNGISGAGWFLVLLICFAGLATYEFHRPNTWWRRTGFDEGVQLFGDAHDFSVSPIHKTVGRSPRLVIESFRGNAKIVGSDGTDLLLNGRKIIRAIDPGDADRANAQTPVTVALEGNTVFVRCSQDKAGKQNQVTTDLDLSIPRGSSIEATGRGGDFDISSISGDIDVSGENGAMRFQNLNGGVKINTHRSGPVNCTDVRGPVTIRGRGSDIELTKIGGPVSVEGDFNGALTLREIANVIRIESMRTVIAAQKLPGEMTLARGSLEVRDVVGPVKLAARSTDVAVNGFSEPLDISVDKGDVELNPGRLPLSKIGVHARSGNIRLALPQTAHFALSAVTSHGDIENEFGDTLTSRTEHHGGTIEGSVGGGPDLSITTDRGSITVRKSSPEALPSKEHADQRGLSIVKLTQVLHYK